MARDVPLSNGRLLICFDRSARIRDLYFPHVGQESHVGGHAFRIGVWTEDRFSWVGPDEQWKTDLLYEKETLVSRANLYNPGLQILLGFVDCVDFDRDVFLREIKVKNLSSEHLRTRLFFHQDFNISGNSIGDTAAFDPESNGIIHYKANRYFLVNCLSDDLDRPFEFATGNKASENSSGTFIDAEDGSLSKNPVAQGSVDSVLSMQLDIAAGEEKKGCYWIAVGKNWQDVRKLNALVGYKGHSKLIKRTRDYWSLWIRKESPPLQLLEKRVRDLYVRSLLVLRTQIDSQGGIVAANDSDSIQFNRDTYSYVWPRDGALVANALDMAGYPVPSRNFFSFISRIIHPDGYLMHKYNPDGSLASSWHPWFEKGRRQLPIQEDETALALWALWNHFVLYRDIEFIKPLYRPFVKKAADFLCRFRDRETGLPLSSYDLWEERHGVHAFTIGTVFGGLTAAALFCAVFGEEELSMRYKKAASEVRDACSRYMWQEERGSFCRTVDLQGREVRHVDMTPDASAWGLFAFGLYAADDPRIVSTMTRIKKRLWIDQGIGGMARYEQDEYYRVSRRVPGNPWFVSTLWFADFLLEQARDRRGVEQAGELLSWVCDFSLPSGVLAEQVHPFTGEPESVSPLTWSHATFVSTAIRLMNRTQELGLCPECGRTGWAGQRREDWVSRLFKEECGQIHNICQVK